MVLDQCGFRAHNGGVNLGLNFLSVKAISASLSDEEVRSILAVEGMSAVTPRTITSLDKFLEELRAVRNRGYAVDEGENEEGGAASPSPCRTRSAPP